MTAGLSGIGFSELALNRKQNLGSLRNELSDLIHNSDCLVLYRYGHIVEFKDQYRCESVRRNRYNHSDRACALDPVLADIYEIGGSI